MSPNLPEVGPELSGGHDSEYGLDVLRPTWLLSSRRPPFTLGIPPAPGAYPIRHGIIALHLADQPGDQIRVGGSGTGAPKPEDLVSLPGVYNDTDPGILVDVFDGGAKPYTFPGPPIAAFVSSSSNWGNSQLELELRRTTKRELVMRPRHISRVMRVLVLGGNTYL
ncbi:hypothetical protein C8J57DRAFT_1547758 [Mycena rebaudengoi]|nr:hypothetical protein C8J57DRAFT_1547758 [Mycena rebaudengoi]